MLLTTGTAAELHALMRAGFPLRRAGYSAILGQLATGPAFSVYEQAADGVPLVLAGLVELPGQPADLWCAIRPGGLQARLLPVVRLARATLRALAPRHPAGIVCFVADGNERGERLAAAAGFSPEPLMLLNHRRWRFIA